MTTFETRRQLAATPEQVFAAFTDPGRLARWWGPAGFSNHFDTFEFRTGGAWKFTMIGPDGKQYPNESIFVKLEPARQVVIRHANAPNFELTITLAPAPGGTLLHWAQAFDDPAVAAALRAIVEPANEQNLDRLTAELARH
jgi:uncharacterized protein YndB with AHSA1/START domain